jgi:hypothetical protein
VKLKPKIKKLCVVKTYINIEEVVVVITEIEQILGELGETPCKPMKEEQDEIVSRKSTTNCQLHVLNETLINLGRGLMARLNLIQHFLPPIIVANYATQMNTWPRGPNSLRCTTKDKKDLVFNGVLFYLIF